MEVGLRHMCADIARALSLSSHHRNFSVFWMKEIKASHDIWVVYGLDSLISGTFHRIEFQGNGKLASYPCKISDIFVGILVDVNA